jgi:peptidoglycan/LPS O-acetylase OafA/YrhL
MAETHGRATGFDYLRIILAVSIICLHSVFSSYGVASSDAVFASAGRPLFRFLMPAFFALSGFLVAGSLERSRTLVTFLGLRMLRIYPALIVESLLSAFILGPLVTTQPLLTYFTAPEFFRYMLNILGDVHFSLPGVFVHNPLPNVVNFQLWTIPFELYSYVTLALVTIIGLRRWRILSWAVMVAITLTYLCVTLLRHHGQLIPVVGALNGALLVATFHAGVGLYLYRDKIPFTPSLAVASAVITALLIGWIPGGDFFAPLPVAYLTIWIGLQNPSKKYLVGSDYSYGIYLYGFAVQQAFVALVPSLRIWWVNFFITIIITMAIAALSWSLIEQPALRLRRYLPRLENFYLFHTRPFTAKPATVPVRNTP